MSRNPSEQASPISAAKVESLAEFARWAIRESCFWGCDLDGGGVQEKAEALGLIVKELYDPGKHGETEYNIEPGDDWFVLAPWLGPQ